MDEYGTYSGTRADILANTLDYGEKKKESLQERAIDWMVVFSGLLVNVQQLVPRKTNKQTNKQTLIDSI